MPKYRIQIDGKEVPIDDIADARIKPKVAELIQAFDAHFKSVQCDVHHLEPLVFTFFESGACTGFGFGPCCEAFARTLSRMAESLKLPGLGSDKSVTIRVLKYSDIA